MCFFVHALKQMKWMKHKTPNTTFFHTEEKLTDIDLWSLNSFLTEIFKYFKQICQSIFESGIIWISKWFSSLADENGIRLSINWHQQKHMRWDHTSKLNMKWHSQRITHQWGNRDISWNCYNNWKLCDIFGKDMTFENERADSWEWKCFQSGYWVSFNSMVIFAIAVFLNREIDSLLFSDEKPFYLLNKHAVHWEGKNIKPNLLYFISAILFFLQSICVVSPNIVLNQLKFSNSFSIVWRNQ